MWNYTRDVMDHFRNPRNVGYIKDADGVGEVGSLACGDALRLMFKLDDQGRIEDVKFQTFGCGSAIATSSVLTEMIKGKTIDEALAVTNKDIVDYLGGLPEQKMHCSVMAQEALEAAVENYRNGTTGKKDIEGRVVCVCFGVTEGKIRRAIEENGLTTAEQVTHYTKAGGGCGGCVPHIEEILKAINGSLPEKEPVASQEAGAVVSPAAGLTNLQKIKLIEKTVEDEIRPALEEHGGGIELVDVVDNRVLVRLQGSCSKCGMTLHTLDSVVLPPLREKVSPELVVEEA